MNAAPKLPTCAICKKPVRGVWASDIDPLSPRPSAVRFDIHCHGAIETIEVSLEDGRAAAPDVAFAGSVTP